MFGKTCMVTGASSGIGLAMAKGLAERGAEVVLVSRDPARAEEALSSVRSAAKGTPPTSVLCDFADLDAVRRFAADWNASGRRIDVLLDNAGAYHATRKTTAQGFEMTMGVNYLAMFLLTNLLLDRLDGGRVVVTGSASHVWGRVRLDDLMMDGRYFGLQQYGNSKLCTMLFARELARRVEGRGIAVSSFHPGVVATRFGAEEPGVVATWMRLMRPFFRGCERGAATGIHLATSEEAKNARGEYYVDFRPAWCTKTARDDELASALWERTRPLVGL